MGQQESKKITLEEYERGLDVLKKRDINEYNILMNCLINWENLSLQEKKNYKSYFNYIDKCKKKNPNINTPPERLTCSKPYFKPNRYNKSELEYINSCIHDYNKILEGDNINYLYSDFKKIDDKEYNSYVQDEI